MPLARRGWTRHHNIGSVQNTVIYGYDNGSWGDLLISFNGQSIAYDGIGNPGTWNGSALTWQGRRLMSYGSNTYTYNADGIRTSKTVNGVEHIYHLSGTQILDEEWIDGNTRLMVYVYDASGQPIGMSHYERGNKMHKNTIIAVIIATVILILSVVCVVNVIKYTSIKNICDEIKAGENINTHIGNGVSAPVWLDDFFVATGLGEVRIPLVEACYYGNMQAVQVLLDNGADPNYGIKGHLTPIDAVLIRKRDHTLTMKMLEILIDNGADVNLTACDSQPLFNVADRLRWGNPEYNAEYEEIICLFLKSGAGIRATAGEYEGNTVLHYAVRGTSAVFVDELIRDYFDDVDPVGMNGETPLIDTVKYHSALRDPELCAEIIKVLLDRGADKNAVDDNGKNAYDYAMEKGLNSLAEMLKP